MKKKNASENAFGEERDENETRAYRIVRGCFKGVLYGASALVWILIFYTIFTTRESSILKKMYFTPETHEALAADKDAQVCQIYLSEFMNQNGSITLSNVWYAPSANEIEIGIKYNRKLVENEDKDAPISYILTDQNGNTYDILRMETDSIGRYNYVRICFACPDLPLTRAVFADDGSVVKLPPERGDPKTVLTLFMNRASDGEPLHTYINEDRTELVNDSKFRIFQADFNCRDIAFDD